MLLKCEDDIIINYYNFLFWKQMLEVTEERVLMNGLRVGVVVLCKIRTNSALK